MEMLKLEPKEFERKICETVRKAERLPENYRLYVQKIGYTITKDETPNEVQAEVAVTEGKIECVKYLLAWDREIFVRRKDRFDRYVLAEPVSENITTRLLTQQPPSAANNSKRTHARLVWCMVALYAWLIFCIIYWLLGFSNWITTVSNTLFTAFFIYLVDFERRRINKNKE